MWYINWLKLAKKLAYIVAIIAAYFILDNLNLMPRFLSLHKNTGNKLEISSAPTVVEEIKQIGEIITAEYYGEVYADLLENYNDTIKAYGDSLKYYPQQLFTHFPGLSAYFYSKDKAKFKRNLIYIARGNVKIGLNFRKLDLENLQIIEQNDTFYIQIPKPEILDVNINPWYIENEIAGFEVFKENPSTKRFTDAEIKAVKEKCKQKLAEEAVEFGLYQKALQNSKSMIEKLLGLMTTKAVSVNYISE